eukprot:scaffold6302_cov61-Cyclotella_meneghiniana.AAC.6
MVLRATHAIYGAARPRSRAKWLLRRSHSWKAVNSEWYRHFSMYGPSMGSPPYTDGSLLFMYGVRTRLLHQGWASSVLKMT